MTGELKVITGAMIVGKERRYGDVLTAKEVSQMSPAVRDALISQGYLAYPEPESDAPRILALEKQVAELIKSVAALKTKVSN